MSEDPEIVTCVVVEATGTWGIAVGRMQGQALLVMFHHTTKGQGVTENANGSAFVLLNDGDLVRVIAALQEQLAGPHPDHSKPGET